MAPTTTCDEPPQFDVDDRVVIAEPLGRRWRRRPIGRSDTGRVEHVHPGMLAYDAVREDLTLPDRGEPVV